MRLKDFNSTEDLQAYLQSIRLLNESAMIRGAEQITNDDADGDGHLCALCRKGSTALNK